MLFHDRQRGARQLVGQMSASARQVFDEVIGKEGVTAPAARGDAVRQDGARRVVTLELPSRYLSSWRLGHAGALWIPDHGVGQQERLLRRPRPICLGHLSKRSNLAALVHPWRAMTWSSLRDATAHPPDGWGARGERPRSPRTRPITTERAGIDRQGNALHAPSQPTRLRRFAEALLEPRSPVRNRASSRPLARPRANRARRRSSRGGAPGRAACPRARRYTPEAA